jgi:hypothetical protein
VLCGNKKIAGWVHQKMSGKLAGFFARGV